MPIEKSRFFDELETMSLEAREKYHNENLKQTVEHAYFNAPLAKKIMDKAGIKPSQIKTVKDLELLPVIRKNDLIEAQQASPPFGGLLAIPASEVERIFISPGPIYEYQESHIAWFARSFYAAGFRRGDIAVNTFTYHMSPAGILFHEGLRQCGATVVVMGTGNTEVLIKAMLDLKITGFVGTPTFLMMVIKRAEEMGHQFEKDFAVTKAWFTGEMLPASIRKVLEDKYHIDTYQAYAVTEPGGAIAYECGEKSGMHLMDEYIVEIIDPQTGRQLGQGETGEIVVTPIHNNSWGLLRFGTGDLSSLNVTKCPCGRTSYKINGIAGRTGDAVKVRGMFVVAKQVEQALTTFEEVSKFCVYIDRRDNRDEMNLQVELKNAFLDKSKLSADINQKFQDICRVKLDHIEFVAQGSIAEPHKTLNDIRKWD